MGRVGHGSAVVGQRHIARFTTIRTIIQAVHSEANILLTLTNDAILFAGAGLFRLIALRAPNLLTRCHEVSERNFT